ncbi:MAG: metal ABC transporter substrate-binding protein [Aggregatilineales bacterium]
MKFNRVAGLVLIVFALMNGFTIVSAQEDSPLQVVATTSIIADVARNVGGDLVEVTSLIPPEADAHSYSLSPQQVVSITQADVVLVNGATLEESLLDIVLDNATIPPIVVSVGVDVLAIGGHNEDENHDEEADHDDHDEEAHEHEAVDYVGVLGDSAECDIDHEDHDGDEAHTDEEDAEHEGEEAHDHGVCDPHFWMSVPNVITWVENIQAAFTAVDPDNAGVYQDNADQYILQLNALNDDIVEMVDTLPEVNRVLVTNHEFLGYFAAEYGFEVVGTVIPSASTLADVNPQDIIALVEVIADENVSAIFAEVSANSDLAETVASEAGRDVAIITLYSEALSAEDGPASTYVDYMRYNATQIVTALGG